MFYLIITQKFSFCKHQKLADVNLAENYKVQNRKWYPWLIRDSARSRWLGQDICARLSRLIPAASQRCVTAQFRCFASSFAWHALFGLWGAILPPCVCHTIEKKTRNQQYVLMQRYDPVT